MDDKKPIIGNERTEEQKETPEKLQYMIAAYLRQLSISENDKARLNALMQRKSAKKWDAAKKAKMVRRYMRAENMINECVETLDQMKHRLSQITTEEPKLAVAPFAPPVPSSLEG